MPTRKISLSVFLLMACTFVQAQKFPAGEVLGPFVWKSKIYPGTEREYWLYVPKQYDKKPTCVMVIQDGLSRATGWNLPVILDSLIAKKNIPVMIGIFIDHGKVAGAGEHEFPRFNRSFEYDGLGDRYARFLLEEIIPEVSKSYNLSTDPNDRSIAGASSGAICAFNVAWERPDAFRRVFSSIGTYVGLRGADELPTLVRKTEPKPLRVFLQDGTQDLNIYAGDWYVANQLMLSALTWAGYEVNHAWGEGGGHDSKHSSVILASALTWLWKDYPSPVTVHKGVSSKVNPVIAGEPWKNIQTDVKVNALAVNKTGDLFFSAGNVVYKTTYGKPTAFVKNKGQIGGISFQGDNNLLISDIDAHKIVVAGENGALSDIVTGCDASYLAVSAKGIYFSDTVRNSIGFYSYSKKEVSYFKLAGKPAGLSLTAEQTFLNVNISNNVFGFSFKVTSSGEPEAGQEYVHYHIPYGEALPGVGGLTGDSENLLYAATNSGIQVADQLGRINFIFSKPAENARDVKIGGPEFDVLYVSCGGKLFARKITGKGVLSWQKAVKPPKPGL